MCIFTIAWDATLETEPSIIYFYTLEGLETLNRCHVQTTLNRNERIVGASHRNCIGRNITSYPCTRITKRHSNFLSFQTVPIKDVMTLCLFDAPALQCCDGSRQLRRGASKSRLVFFLNYVSDLFYIYGFETRDLSTLFSIFALFID